MQEHPFVMRPKKPVRLRYLFLTIAPPITVTQTILKFLQTGSIPHSKPLEVATIIGCFAATLLLGYFLILRKNHTLTFYPNRILETSNSGRRTTHAALRVMYYRRNFLGEYILTDGIGNKILCIESNMTNHDRFLIWLAAHHIESK